MKDINFIKWMCEKAEEFDFRPEYDDRAVQYQGEPVCTPCQITHRFHPMIYPLLLQRAIEGINREEGRFDIEQLQEQISVCDNEKHVVSRATLIKHNSIDQAKESALKYIYEQEKTW